MVKALLQGMLLGLTLALLVGPAFFVMIQTSITNGFKSGIALACGIFLGDVLCIVLAYLGASQLFNNNENKLIMGTIGGIILIAFGLFNIFQKHPPVPHNNIEIKNINIPLTIIKGFFLNILNPFVLVFWVGAVSVVSSKYEFSLLDIIVFFVGTLSVVLATDIFKSFLALKIKEIIKPQLLVILHRFAGAILIIFGFCLIYRVLF